MTVTFRSFIARFSLLLASIVLPSEVSANCALQLARMDEDPAYANAKDRAPFRYQFWRDCLDLFPIPLSHYGFLCSLVSSHTDHEDHAIVLLRDRRREIALDHAEQVALSPNVVALPVQIFAGCFTLLLTELPLLLLDPGEFGDREYADRVEAHARRRGNSHAARGGDER